ncbi:hypothetical protein [Arthrobacter sp. 260]|uniref:hypothetical protein n=1 Tax=Arthrobacter sp. 260 TaxID=2735314 RepID=UPI00149299FA|nr:hypothetical protein [Arthrobacter sp. 260]NOJ61015.1 hypothetical protein [Arthrobacter sp. 260]
MSTATHSRVRTEAALPRISINTVPNASAEELHRIIGAALDEVALGFVLLAPPLRKMPWGSGTDSEIEAILDRELGEQVEIGGHPIRTNPPYRVLAQIRSDVLQIKSISYTNPLEIVIGGIFVGGAALLASIAKFIEAGSGKRGCCVVGPGQS